MTRINPVYFGVAVWGREFCESFVKYALASLLADGNIPSLDNTSGKNCFFIYTTSEDKCWLQEQPILELLARFMRIEFLEMTPITEVQYEKLNNALRSSKLYTMTMGHRQILERMHADKATGSIVIADSIYSNKSIATAYQHIKKGKTAVLVFCPRFSTTSLVDELAENKQPNAALSIESRDLIKVAMKHLHTDMQMQQWHEPSLPEFMMEAAWMLPNNSGLLCHTWACWYAFIDYSQIETHNTDSLDSNTIDGIYFHDNLKQKEVHLITDSDEFTLISFSPDIQRKQIPLKIMRYLSSEAVLNFLKVTYMKKKIKNESHIKTDSFKLQFASQAIYMHSQDLTDECLALKIEAQDIIKNILEGKLSVFSRLILCLVEEQFSPKRITHRLIVKILPGKVTEKIRKFKRSKNALTN